VPAGSDARPLATNTLKLRLAAIAYLHYLAGLPSPTTTAVVTETYAGMHRVAVEAGSGPRPKLAARIALLREILALIQDDLPGLRDRALLLVALPARSAAASSPAWPSSTWRTASTASGSHSRSRKETARGRVCRLAFLLARARCAPCGRWPAGARPRPSPRVPSSAASGSPPRPKGASPDWVPAYRVGWQAIDPRTVARIVQTRGAAAGFDPASLGGHSLKRGALNTAKDLRVHPARLKQLGRHKSYAPLAAYIEEGDLFADNALSGVL
jgi:hypothetical protein